MPAIVPPSGLRARTHRLRSRPALGSMRRREYGQGLVEYALILVLVAITAIGSLTLVGRQTSGVFAEINCNLSGGTFHQDNGNGNSNRCVGAHGNGGGGGGGGGGQP